MRAPFFLFSRIPPAAWRRLRATWSTFVHRLVLDRVGHDTLIHGGCRLFFPGTAELGARCHFDCANVFLRPSISEVAVGITYEAIVMGAPLVVSAAGSFAHRRISLVSPDSDALSEAIDAVASDRLRRTGMAQCARAHARWFDWDAFKQNFHSSIPSLRPGTLH